MISVKITAVGDILMWKKQIQSAKISENDYSFDYMFSEVTPFFKESDLVIGNLETIFSGRERYYQQINQKTRWPMFNCPDELAATLKKLNFNVLTTANNHCLDRDVHGLRRTLDILDKTGFYHTGTFRSLEESKKELVIDVKGLKVGILAYTYGTNLNLIPKDEPWMVNMISNNTLNQIHSMKKKADVIIICLHFGVEFRRYSSKYQRYWVQKCFEHGADIVLGAHPHVIQPMKVEKVRDIDGIQKNRFVIYSLGNFISDIMNRNIHTISGLILNLTISKNSEGDVTVTDINYIPTCVYRYKLKGRIKFSVLPIGKYLKKIDSQLSPEFISIMNTIWTNTTTHLGGKAK